MKASCNSVSEGYHSPATLGQKKRGWFSPQRVEAAQNELQMTNARASELEEHAARLSFEREEAVRERLGIQDKLDEANREIRDSKASWTNRPPRSKPCEARP
jgi:hypothetical protein